MSDTSVDNGSYTRESYAYQWNSILNLYCRETCLLLGPPGFNCWFCFAPVYQWCCLTPQGSPGVSRNTLFLSSPHLCFIIVFICNLFVSRDDPLMGKKTFTPTEQLYILSYDRSRERGLDPENHLLNYFNTDRSKAVLLLWFLTVTCFCCPYLYFGSAIVLVIYFSKF